MLVQALQDLVLLARMRHEVVLDHATVKQSLHIELLGEDCSDQSVLLSRSEALVLGATGVAELERLVLILQLDHQLLPFCLPIQQLIGEEDKHDDFFLGEERVPEDPIVIGQVQALELVDKHIDAPGVRHEEIVGLLRSLGGRIELHQKLLSRLVHHLVVSSLFGCLTTLVPMIDIAIARANDQVQGVHMFRSEGEMKSVVAEIVAFKHLRL